MRHWPLSAAITFVIVTIFAGPAIAVQPIPVCVSIAPQKYFVQQIGRERVNVRIMVKPGASPATYEPKPRQMAALAKTKIYFAIGVPFENAWLPRIAAANPEMRVVHTDQGIAKVRMATHYSHNDEHRQAETEANAADSQRQVSLDPHIWLSPPLVKIQARTVLTALQAIDPAHKNVYAANFSQFSAGIDQLDADLWKILAGKQGLRFIVFHPSWGYFASAYALRQVPIEMEGKNPKPAQLQDLIEHAREHQIKVVFVQPQFSTRNAALVAREIGGQVAFADPLAANWMANLRNVANKFKLAMK